MINMIYEQLENKNKINLIIYDPEMDQKDI